jgi:multisubunit Na+/H+ antiporter MnhB subunit
MIALAGTGKALNAQAAFPVGTHFADTASKRSIPDPDRTFYLRAAPAILVGATSTMVLLSGAYFMFGDCYDCGISFQALMAVTAAVGVVGTATGASYAEGRGLCTRRERFRKSLGGTALGLAAGLLLIDTHPLQHSIFATIPIGSVMFLRRC